MKTIVALAISLFLKQAAVAASPTAAASGSSALALAAIVAESSSLLSAQDKSVLARLFQGDLNVTFPASQKISVKADAVVCRAGNVDITARSCELTFGTNKRTLTGRLANELYATAVEAGVPSDGAAGTIYESFSHLVCTIDPNEIKQKAGGGAQCTFNTGQ